MTSILFVCTGNLCRSPMAMALLRRRLSGSPEFWEWRIESAGTWANEGDRVPSKVQAVMQERRADLSEHRARRVTAQLLHQFTLILVMSRGQREALRVEFPEIAGRIFLLSELAGEDYDIADPIDGPIAEVRLAAREIDQLLGLGLVQLINKAPASAPGIPASPLVRGPYLGG